MKTQHRRTVLAIDDDEINLTILSKCAAEAGFAVQSFDNSAAGWEHLHTHPREVDIVLLDKMMPELSGMEFLKKIKRDKEMQHLPVILQTGDAGLDQMREGLENGAFYYLTKPFHPEILTAILHSAANECAMREQLLSQMGESQSRFVSLMEEGVFSIRTHQEASLLAASLSQASLYPEFVAVGLMELLTNAIEHGNLEFGFDAKSKALMHKTWQAEVDTRLTSPELGKRRVHVSMRRLQSGMVIHIRDEGKGFDWQKYLLADQSPGNLADPNGRGISKAVVMLDNVQYMGNGNEVQCHIALASMFN
ncbi:MAG: response regulator [Rickettsiales bacterium]|nr:response regulator [Rickettsiales bacterium]